MNVKIISISLSVLIFVFIIDLVRREKMTFKYAFIWLLLSSVSIVFAIFDSLLFKLAYYLGFELPSNFIFFGCFLGVVILSLLLTIFLCQQNQRNELMSQKLGILENEVEKIKSKVKGGNS